MFVELFHQINFNYSDGAMSVLGGNVSVGRSEYLLCRFERRRIKFFKKMYFCIIYDVVLDWTFMWICGARGWQFIDSLKISIFYSFNFKTQPLYDIMKTLSPLIIFCSNCWNKIKEWNKKKILNNIKKVFREFFFMMVSVVFFSALFTVFKWVNT